ncbi:MAG: hypothetical protein ACK50B_05670 [Betaproteobacteria bacterium]
MLRVAAFGGKIEFEIDGATLQVFVARRTPRHTFERQQIYRLLRLAAVSRHSL